MTLFQKAFKSKNRLSSLEIVYAASPDEAYRQVIRSFSKKIKPAIVFCMSDEILSGAIKAIQKLKLKIPGDVKIITISNDGFIPKLFEPEITYVETSGFELGKLCFRRMKDYMNGKTFIQKVLLPAKLVRGNSI